MFKQNRTKFLLDIAIFVAFLITMDPRTSGIAVHEWLTIALSATIIVHLLLNWKWIVQVTKRLFTGGLNGSRVNYILIMLSGIMISEAVIPALGFTLPENFTWRGLHDFSANISLLLMGLHLALHWNWIVSIVKRLFGRDENKSVTLLERKDAQA
jgi:hypothetical protein